MRVMLTATVMLFAQLLVGQDHLVKSGEVKFNSELEKTNFNDFFNGKNPNYPELFLSLNKSIDENKSKIIVDRINNLVGEIRSTNYQDKKPQKQIKSVYQKIHDAFLTKYEMENRFHEIFESGKYNCVTATALYAIVFDKLEIPYVIKEEPTHVYLVAYPDVHNILVETTTPAFGFINFDQAFKTNFINNLKNQKIISKTESEGNSTEQLFNKYYFTTENIDLKKLVGIHYMNDAIFLQEKGDMKSAFEQAEKAYLFYPSKRCQYLIASFGVLQAANGSTSLEPLERATLISKLSRHKNMGITNDMIKGEFHNISQDVIVKNNDKELYKKCFYTFIGGLDDQELINDITYYYNYENGRIYYNQGNFENARNYFRKSLEIQPSNVDLGLIFSQCLSKTFRPENTSAILDTMQMYRDKFPTLMEIQNFKAMLGTSYLLEFQNAYTQGKTDHGNNYQYLFEELMNNDSRLFVNYDVIGQAYSTASTYYFKRGQKTKAKELVATGLKYAPGSYELRTRQQMLSR